MNWIEQEIIESIKSRISSRKELFNLSESEVEKYKDKTKTDNKYEAAFFEYWRTVKLLAKEEIKYLSNLLDDIEKMAKEEIEEYEELYEG